MARKVKFFVRVSKKTNEATIRVRFSNGKQFDVTANTNELVNPDHWNNTKGTYRSVAELIDYDDKVSKLENIEAAIKKEYDNNTPNFKKYDDTKEGKREKSSFMSKWLNTAIDKYYNPNKYLQNNTTLFGFIQHFVNNSDKRINPKTGKPVCYKMKREYEVTFNYIKEYAEIYGEPDFIDMDLDFYQQFTDLLRKKGLMINTIGKKIQTLKVFLNSAYEKSINPYQKYKSKNFNVTTQEVDNIYLNKEELNKLYEHNFSENIRLEKVRDLFIVACWTGLRFSDLKQINLDRIKGDYIQLKQSKTGKDVVIPLHFTVTEILKKYKGKLPTNISNQKYNEYIKEAAEKAKIKGSVMKKVIENGMEVDKKHHKYDLISSHTARRSFCTNAYKDNIPTIAIMAISGHKTETAFLKYIKADAEEHAKKVLEIWKKNGEFMRVAK